jgi:O-acetyl-ADP-ribose deacetylase (regulator of RNase III)
MAMETHKTSRWTNPSVQKFAGGSDPLALVTRRAKEVVMQAIQDGWQGPPFDPFRLADILGIPVTPREDIPEARIVPIASKPQIEFNPNMPRRRVRFSMAHEIAHTLFPDWIQAVRNRGGTSQVRADDWELELLCNIAASEFLIPTGDMIDATIPPTVEVLIHLQSTYDVSMEAAAFRLAQTSAVPCIVAVGSRRHEAGVDEAYRIDYAVSSRASPLTISRWAKLEGSVFSQCTAIGFTAKGTEPASGDLPSLYWECVGLPPYPGRTYPRVLGIARPSTSRPSAAPRLTFLYGNALEPRGKGLRLITQIVNDKSRTWGAGFSRAARERYPEAHDEFERWAGAGRRNLALGMIHVAALGNELCLVSMVAQHGYGPSPKPRIRYAALRDCLQRVREIASQKDATVHMPRIGTGFAGGNWSYVCELIDECLIRENIPVTVYSLPGQRAGETGGPLTALGTPKRGTLEEWASG